MLFCDDRTLSKKIRYGIGSIKAADVVFTAKSSSSSGLTWRELVTVLRKANIDVTVKEPTAKSSATSTGGIAHNHNRLLPDSGENHRPANSDSALKDINGLAKEPVILSSAIVSRPKDNDSKPTKAPVSLTTSTEANPILLGRELFMSIDRNRDGVVSHVELIRALRNQPGVAEVNRHFSIHAVINY